jgi:hypothetical protein
MVVRMPSSFERREPPDPLPRCEGLASEGADRFFLLARVPSGEQVRVRLGRVSATELRRLFVVGSEEGG